MSGLAKITKGMIAPKGIVINGEVTRIYYPLTINISSKKPYIAIDRLEKVSLTTEIIKPLNIAINKQEPTIIVRPIKKKITLKCRGV